MKRENDNWGKSAFRRQRELLKFKIGLRTGAIDRAVEDEKDLEKAVDEALVAGIARELALVRDGVPARQQVAEDLADLMERLEISPEILADALIYHERILGTDEGLDGDLGGGSSVPRPQLV